jgi:hypothetical protein
MAEIHQVLGGRPLRHRAPERCHRLVDAVEFDRGVAEIDQRDDALGRQLERAAVAGQRRARVAAHAQRHAERVPGLGARRTDPHRVLGQGDGLGVTARLDRGQDLCGGQRWRVARGGAHHRPLRMDPRTPRRMAAPALRP